jgi:hypothetical protein
VSDGNGPGENQGIAPEAAAADLRGSVRAVRTASGETRDPGIIDQIFGLTQWGAIAGRFLEAGGWLRPAKNGGMEHELWFNAAQQRYVKITLPGRYGQYPTPRPDGTPGLRPATPLEYLDRLALSNRLFADDWLVEGLVESPAGPRIVTSQPVIVGERPDEAEIDAYMGALGFQRMPGKSYFLNEESRIAVFDGHEGNFLRGEEGQIFAIDVIPVPLSPALWRSLQAVRREKEQDEE